jgi:hypothetical protein
VTTEKLFVLLTCQITYIGLVGIVVNTFVKFGMKTCGDRLVVLKVARIGGPPPVWYAAPPFV